MQFYLSSFGRFSISFFLFLPLFLISSEWLPSRFLKNQPFQEPVWVQLKIVKDEAMKKYDRVDEQVEFMLQGGFWLTGSSPKYSPEKTLIQKIQELPEKWMQKKSFLREID